jgi:hypothetical protein
MTSRVAGCKFSVYEVSATKHPNNPPETSHKASFCGQSFLSTLLCKESLVFGWTLQVTTHQAINWVLAGLGIYDLHSTLIIYDRLLPYNSKYCRRPGAPRLAQVRKQPKTVEEGYKTQVVIPISPSSHGRTIFTMSNIKVLSSPSSSFFRILPRASAFRWPTSLIRSSSSPSFKTD